MKKAVGRFFCVAFVCLIVASALGSLISFPWSRVTSSEQTNANRPTDALPQRTSVPSYVAHAPIFITSDAVFDSLASANGWPGNGLTPATPYKISGYSIVDTVYQLIAISGTTRYFVIQNNLLNAVDAGCDGIFLYDADNGRIESNVITNCRHGVYLKACSGASVWNNTISPCTESGIRVYQSAATLSQNNIGSAEHNGIWLEAGSGVKVLNNEIHDNTENGVFFDGRQEGSDYGTNNYDVVEYNYIHGVDNGVFLYHEEGAAGSVNANNVSYNTFADTTYSAVYLSGTNVFGNRITGNNISTSGGYGIVMDRQTRGNILSLNRMHGSSQGGIYITLGAFANIIDRNTIYDCPLAIWIEGGAGSNTAMFNTLYDPNGLTMNGIGFRVDAGCNTNVFINNTVSNSTSYGAYISGGTDDNVVKWNSFLGNNLGGSSQALCDNETTSEYYMNFWDDWTWPDDNHDGYVDFPYEIDGTAGTTDPLPLALPMNPVGYHTLTPIRVIYPNGGELINGSATIAWTASEDSYRHNLTYTVLYSDNAGSDWYKIVAELTTTSHVWDTSSLTEGSQYLVKVIAECSELLTTVDTSDATFTIQAHELTSPELTYPLTNDNVYGTVTIRWQASLDSWGGGVTYAVYYSGNGGTDWSEIASGLTATSCSWNTAGLPGGGDYVVKVVAGCTHEESVEALSGAFTLVPTTTSTTTTTTAGPTGGGMDFSTLLLIGTGLVAVLVVACVVGRSKIGHGGGAGP